MTTTRLPKDARRHLRSACKENLLAMRALLDVLIEELEPAPARASAPSERSAKPRAPRRRRSQPAE